MSFTMDLIDEIMDSEGVRDVVTFFDPEKTAGILKALLEIYEETFSTSTVNLDYVLVSFEKIVLSHKGWAKYMDSPGDGIIKSMGPHAVVVRLYDAGRTFLIQNTHAE